MSAVGRRMGGMTEITGSTPEWEKRFRAPRVGLPDWAEDAPDRSLFVSNATGTYELYAWDRATGEQRRATDRPNGTTDGVLTPDGEWIWWFDDTDGDEFGVWLRQPFRRRPATSRPCPGSPRPTRRASRSAGTARRWSAAPPTRTARRSMSYGPGAAPGRDLPAPRVGGRRRPVARRDADRRSSTPSTATRCTRRCGWCAWTARRSPSWTTPRAAPRSWGSKCSGSRRWTGDTRLLVAHQRRGRWEPMIWDVAVRRGDRSRDRPARRRHPPSGIRTAPGCSIVAQLRGAQRAVPLRPRRRARSIEIETPAGYGVGGDGPARRHGGVPVVVGGPAPPRCAPRRAGSCSTRPGSRRPGPCRCEDAWVEGPGGRDPRPGAAARRARARSRRSSRSTAGRPGTTATRSRAGPAAWVDHGYAVVRVNYRGSTGYGRAVDRRAQAPGRADRAGGHRGGPRVGGRLGSRRPGAARPGGRLLGRLSHAARPRHPARRVGGWGSRRCRSRTTSRRTTTRWKR